MPKIGEGTYGCVHKPSLKCKNKRISYKGKISKILHFSEAFKEMNEYSKIRSIDAKKQFYQGDPIECDPVDNEETRQEIDKCSVVSSKDSADYKLLIMNDGGVDLSIYDASATKTRENINAFWIEVRRVIEGVSVLVKNKTVHHDLKPQNIVYFEDNHRINFIDFGLMTTMDKIKYECNNSTYGFAILHATFPFEMSFLNKHDYMEVSKRPDYYSITLLRKILTSPQNMFFSAITNGRSKQRKDEIVKFITEQYQAMMAEDIKPDNYNAFLEKSTTTIDVYGLGYTFLYMLGRFIPYMDSSFADDLEDLFLEAVHPRVSLRITADELLHNYDEILKKHSILHTPVVKTKAARDKCEQLGKELNPMTKRCTIKCKPGQIRDDKFKCVGCTSDKEMNPLTKRCTKKCQPGLVRDDKFKCKRPKV